MTKGKEAELVPVKRTSKTHQAGVGLILVGVPVGVVTGINMDNRTKEKAGLTNQ